MKERKCKRCPECGRVLSSWLNKKVVKYKCYACEKMVKPSKTVDSTSGFHGVTKRSLKDVEHSREWMSREDLIDTLYQMGEDGYEAKEQAFVALLFLTGARVSELCTRSKIKWINGQKIVDKEEGIRKDQFYKEDDAEGHKYIIIRGLRVLKTRKVTYRKVPISLEHNEEIWKFVANYLNQLEYDQTLFKFNRQWGWVIVKEATGLFPHALRDMRVPDLVRTEGWRDSDRVKFIGWKTRSMLEHYDSIDVADLMERVRFGKNKI